MTDAEALPFADEPILSALAAYWSGLRRGRPMPERTDVSPLAIPKRVLPFLIIAEFIDDSPSVRFRLVGTEMVEHFGFDFTGKTTAEITTGTYRAYLEGVFALVRQSGEPVYSESVFRWDRGGTLDTRRLMLPLAEGGREPGQVLIGQVWPRDSRADSLPASSKLIPSAIMDRNVHRLVQLP
jgi:hypothetical protein